MMNNSAEIERKIFTAKKKLAELDAKRSSLLARIKQLQKERDVIDKTSAPASQAQSEVSNKTSEAEKILLFRNLFKGREDVYPRRFKSRRTGKTGYQPACGNEWIKGICEKPKTKCNECGNREFLPLTNEVIRNHLLGVDQKSKSKDDFTIGVYPLLLDETCWFIAIADEAERQGRVLGVREVMTDEGDEAPWTAPPSRRRKESSLVGLLPDQIELILENQIYIEKTGLPPVLLNRLVQLAAFQNPEFYRAQAMRLSTFNKPRIINCSEDFPKHIGLPRGCLDEVIALLKNFKIEPRIIDKRITGNPIALEFQGALRPDQQMAAKLMLSYDTGVLSATTAFGKTIVAAYLIAERRANTLILVHRRQLLDQWVDRLCVFLGLDQKEIGQIGGGKRKRSGNVDVALIQSLSRKGVVDDIVATYGHLIVDECHHISARSFEIVARQCKARYITGLSATVIRKDGHHPIIFMQCGPVRHRVNERIQAAARPFEHKVVVRNTVFKIDRYADLEDLPIQKLYAMLVNDENRNNLIIDDVISAVDRERSPILITERIEHLAILEDRLSPFIKNLIVLRGGKGQKVRQRIAKELKSIPEDEERLILSTGRYIGEGFDDARLDTLFLALPVSWRGTLSQYAGRLHRLHDMKKEVLIYDYVDPEVPVLAKMYKRRLAGYKAIGYKIHENL